ncbi:uncharacterized protein [Apteryx mantelli]|uniref:Uncharacterized protein isoform X2 n=1 Tax=Apteryx mantelli TaxID=2696672 RepID=A0ABM4FAT9_9AVES
MHDQACIWCSHGIYLKCEVSSFVSAASLLPSSCSQPGNSCKSTEKMNNKKCNLNLCLRYGRLCRLWDYCAVLFYSAFRLQLEVALGRSNFHAKMRMEHEYYSSVSFWCRFPAYKEKTTANSNILAFKMSSELRKLKTQCQICRWSSVHLLVDKCSFCHKYLQSCQLTQQKGLRLTEHQDNYLSILADVMDESVLLT